MTAPKGTTVRTCPVCGGRGIIPTPDGSKWQLCPRCHGKGYIIVVIDNEPWRPTPHHDKLIAW